MASGGAAASGLRLLETDRQRPLRRPERDGGADQVRQRGAVGRVARAAGAPFHLVVDVDGVQVPRPVAECRGALRIEFGRQGRVVTLEAKRIGVGRERRVERRRVRRREQGDLGRGVRLVTRPAVFVPDGPVDRLGAGDFVLHARNRAPLLGDRLVVAAQAGGHRLGEEQVLEVAGVRVVAGEAGFSLERDGVAGLALGDLACDVWQFEQRSGTAATRKSLFSLPWGLWQVRQSSPTGL